MCCRNKTNGSWSQICHALPIALAIALRFALPNASTIAPTIALVTASDFVPLERAHLLQTKAL
jgi:hypothetical protein